jgi:hypothetical protein
MADATAQATERAQEVAGQRSTEAGQQVSTAAGDLRSVSEELRKQGKDTPARLAEQAADRTERLGSYLSESDADRILGDVEDFARRQPWAVVAGGLVLGFAASRLLKASSSERYQQRSNGSSTAVPATTGGNGADPATPRLPSTPAPPAPPAAQTPPVAYAPPPGHMPPVAG